jgi:hypothetical protein
MSGGRNSSGVSLRALRRPLSRAADGCSSSHARSSTESGSGVATTACDAASDETSGTPLSIGGFDTCKPLAGVSGEHSTSAVLEDVRGSRSSTMQPRPGGTCFEHPPIRQGGRHLHRSTWRTRRICHAYRSPWFACKYHPHLGGMISSHPPRGGGGCQEHWCNRLPRGLHEGRSGSQARSPRWGESQWQVGTHLTRGHNLGRNSGEIQR